MEGTARLSLGGRLDGRKGLGGGGGGGGILLYDTQHKKIQKTKTKTTHPNGSVV
jgi:hypothetical protein